MYQYNMVCCCTQNQCGLWQHCHTDDTLVYTAIMRKHTQVVISEKMRAHLADIGDWMNANVIRSKSGKYRVHQFQIKTPDNGKQKIGLLVEENSKARLVTHTPKCEHVTLVLNSLHQLPVIYMLQYKVPVCTQRALEAPQQLK